MESIPKDFYLNDPELKERHLKAIPAKELYRFMPSENEVILLGEKPQKNIRFIFTGRPKNNFEKEKYNKLKDFLVSKKFNLPENWDDSDTFRLLQASDYDIEKTYKMLKENLLWRNSFPPSMSPEDIIIINSGLLYIYGRDTKYRPILVIEAQKLNELRKGFKFEIDKISNACAFTLMYLFNNLLIPGQIENITVMCDLNGMGVSDLGEFKKILNTLNNFRGRVYKNFLLNVTGFLKFALKSLLPLFGSASSKKIIVLEKEELGRLQEHIRPDNIQLKYGGTAPNVIYGGNNLFPPVMPSNKYQKDGDNNNLIDEKTYKEMCLNGNPFKPAVICEEYVQKWNKIFI